ncbi:NETI motif-containing protein [Peribacillus frigoritolerans]|nr:NETI motif-containing protein [Peribacillus frigoritolerans]
MSKKSKEKFEVIEGETIDACLDRIKAAGYFPVRRTERAYLCRENREWQSPL